MILMNDQVVNKLFEFMHESHPGVQDMACETFLKIAQKCRRKFVLPQAPENSMMASRGQPGGGGPPFINDILEDLPKTIRDLQVVQFPSKSFALNSAESNVLQVHQIHMFYEALGYMLQAEYESKAQEALLNRLMELPNQMWGDYIAQVNVPQIQNACFDNMYVRSTNAG